ncbi:zinc ribbon domain-containing protein [Acidiphilium multivorum]|uniref:zinc ribbon domain-containing protein n=1 Tax=Acidiphilium multivorum TaxID=62140 RepID=UPI0039C93B3B
MGLFFIWILLGCGTGAIAKSKGRSFFLWMIYGFLIFIVALPHAILLKTDRKDLNRRAAVEGMVKCPECAEMVRAEARRCRYCGAALDQMFA